MSAVDVDITRSLKHEHKVPPKPEQPCYACGLKEWWWRESSHLGGPGDWVCQKCHPNPNENIS
jgi:hypothetical protein